MNFQSESRISLFKVPVQLPFNTSVVTYNSFEHVLFNFTSNWSALYFKEILILDSKSYFIYTCFECPLKSSFSTLVLLNTTLTAMSDVNRACKFTFNDSSKLAFKFPREPRSSLPTAPDSLTGPFKRSLYKAPISTIPFRFLLKSSCGITFKKSKDHFYHKFLWNFVHNFL